MQHIALFYSNKSGSGFSHVPVRSLEVCSKSKYLLLEAIGESVRKHDFHLVERDAVKTTLVLFRVVGLGRENANGNAWGRLLVLFC